MLLFVNVVFKIKGETRQPVITKTFHESKIPHKVTVSTYTLYSEWNIAAKKMRNRHQFGRKTTRMYCHTVCMTSCKQEYEDSVDHLVKEFVDDGDLVRAEHV